ncbi:MAG: CoA transferase, partial [Acidimicrobiales bacterium]
LDERLAGWTAGRSAAETVEVCHSVGVSAAAVLDEQALFADPHLAARRWFRPNHCDDVDTILFPGHQWRWGGPEMRWDQLNMMGRDNDYVYRELLGKTEAEMDALRAERHLADGYLDADGNPL